MNKKPRSKKHLPYPLLPGEKADIREEAAGLVPEVTQWLNTPHARLGGKTPNAVIGTAEEPYLRNLLRMIKYGIPT